jgi:MFS transporter, DHA1 family, inner membrane transport protein
VTARQLRVLALAGLAVFLVSFDSSVLVLALPAIASELHSAVPALTDLGSALALGSLAAVPLSMLADRLGRRRVLAAAVAAFSAANLASAAAPTLAWLTAARAVAACFETVAASAATALVIEEMPAARRGLGIAAIVVMAGAGIGLTTLLYPLLAPHWRPLYLAGSAGLVAALVLAAFLPESRAWAAVAVERGLAVRLLGTRPWRGRLLVVALAAAMGSLLFAPAGLLVALFASQQLRFEPAAISAVIVVSGLASIPAFPLGGALSDRVGRRGTSVVLSALTACFAAATFTGSGTGYWAGSVLWSVLASAASPALGAWYGELFPTRARATSQSMGAAAGALGGVVGFQLVGALQPHLGLGLSLMTTAAGALLAAGLLLLLPETRGEPLPP